MRVQPFGIPRGSAGAILADPPTRFQTWSKKGRDRAAEQHYRTMSFKRIMALPVREIAAPDCCLFLWATWPALLSSLAIIEAWGFTYKTCAFDWAKVSSGRVQIGLGYWTRANSEPCLFATRGKPKRLNADVSQLIVEPRREHSRKPDCVHARIERLVAGPYVELFARSRRRGWHCWGNETEKFKEVAE